MKKDFVTIRDLSTEEIYATFKTVCDMKKNPQKFVDALKGKALAMIFEKPSLRTRVSFDVGIHQLGGFSVCLLPDEIKLGKRESIHDVAKNLDRMVQGIMIRTFAHSIVEDLALYSSVPVINALTDYSHPCQAMADFFTIQESKGSVRGLKIAFVGDGNNVAHSLMFAGARLGAHVTVACPIGYEPNRQALRDALEDARESKAKIEITHDVLEGVCDADVVYTDVWASMGQESEAAARRSVFKSFQVNGELFSRAKPDAIFMHCLPAHRGEEVTNEVIDAPSSVVFRQAENRLHVQKALMFHLMK